jgi:hypothetical protein
MGTGKNLDVSSTTAIRTWFNSNANDTTLATNASGLLVSPYNFTAGDYRLSANSLAATGADFTDSYILAAGVGIRDLTKSSYEFVASLYPNPAKDNVVILLNHEVDGASVNIEVMDVTGKIVLCKTENSKTTKINLSTDDLINGLYFIKIKSGKFISTQKLLINK